MTPVVRRLIRGLRRALTLTALVLAAATGVAGAAPLADDGGAEWQVEQPLPPAPEVAGAESSEAPVSLGHIGDVEFYEPNRGALITSGNGGSVKAGVWFYDGASWRELSTQCGAGDGRIAWAGPDEFWTVSDGRPGQAVASSSERPPLADNTLCHFAPGPAGNIEIVGSYASVPFLGSSYQAMHAAGCLSPSNCWFGGEPLPPPQVGAFMLHWNGAGLEPQPFLPEGHPVWGMTPYEGRLLESMRVQSGDKVVREVQRPAALRTIKAEVSGEESFFEAAQPENHFLYWKGEFSTALDYLRLSTSEGALWVGAGAQVPGPERSKPAGVTILRKPAGGEWETVIGPLEGEGEEGEPPGQIAFPKDVLASLAAEPGGSSAWLGLDPEADVLSPNRLERASLARVSSNGEVSDRLELPLPEDAHGPLGSAQRVVCPAPHDCWASTAGGWLLHLATSGEREHPDVLSDPVFARVQAGEPVTFRPPDAGVPQEPLDELPEDTSGEELFTRDEKLVKPPAAGKIRIPVPLLTHVRSRVVGRTHLILSFHLAVKARVRLLALRKRKVVARSAKRTLGAGARKLELRLDPKSWPEHLKLQTEALAPLPTQGTSSPSIKSISTSFVAPARLLSSGLTRW
ncbi:MAG TPA: hypothetical protein VN618_10020 [Solirubrobacteraceae bacterium]|nr:hypothetical protein [Solirubrobacteraceae bacterium]